MSRPWEVESERKPRRRLRRPASDRATVRRLTAGAAVGSIALTGVLFVQVGVQEVGVDAVDRAIISALTAIFPALRPVEAPIPGPGGPPIVATGGS